VRHIRFAAACLGVAASLGAAAASALAQAPEFGRCVKDAGGIYANAGCTEAKAGSARYEWEPGPGPSAGFTEAQSGPKAFKWKLATNEEGVCTGETATGEYTGPKTVGDVDIVLTGCVFYAVYESCETVVLRSLGGEIGVYALGETAARDKLGLKLAPEVGTQFAEFDCSTGRVNPYIWRGGSVIVPLQTNKMLLKESLKYRESHGPGYREEQIPASFVGELPSPMEATGNFFEEDEEKGYAPMGWETSPKLFNEEKLEANAVL
jgi:hypothetical protein